MLKSAMYQKIMQVFCANWKFAYCATTQYCFKKNIW